jgi:uncharacterized protein
MNSSIASGSKRLLGFATGLAFGALLQRGRLSRHEVIARQLLLRDDYVAKTMATAVAVGAVGLHVLERKGITAKDVKPMKVGGVTLGAVLFGTGLAVAGYCPGTSVAALGEGRRDALATVVGMLAGAGVFVALYPRLVPIIDAGGDLGKRTLPSLAATASARRAATKAGASEARISRIVNARSAAS